MATSYVQGPAVAASTDNALVRWDGTSGRLVQNSASGPYASDTGLLGVATSAPTHSITLSSTATGIASYNTVDQVTNYERAELVWATNVATLRTVAGGTGNARALALASPAYGLTLPASGATGLQLSGSSGSQFTIGHVTNGTGVRLQGALNTQTIACVDLRNGNSLSAAAGTQVMLGVFLTAAQTGTAGYKAVRVDVTETTTGSGQRDLVSLEVGGAQRARIGSNGNLYSSMQTAIPAGGAANTGLFVSSTAGFGVYYGSGAPTVSAAKGSLYLRSDGSGTNDRAYLNTDGGTTWTALVTVA